MARSNQQGVTLLELMLAMFFLATALLGLAASYPLALFGVTSGGFQTNATLLAQQCLDIAKYVPYDRVNLTDLGVACPVTPPGFTRTITVDTTITGAAPNIGEYKTVTVIVTFIGGAGGSGAAGTIATTLATIRSL